jgi:hypothetical protein
MREFATARNMFDLMARQLAAAVIADISFTLRAADGVMMPQNVAVETVNEALGRADAEHRTEEEGTQGTLRRQADAKRGVLRAL